MPEMITTLVPDQTWGRLYWPFFLIVVSLLFLGPELIALFTNSANTLSGYSWRELHVGRIYPSIHTVAWWVSLAAWVVSVIVVTLHIWWKSLP